MSCDKCCYNPCDRTAICTDGTYFTKDIHGNLIKIVELPESTKRIISRAVEKALGIRS